MSFSWAACLAGARVGPGRGLRKNPVFPARKSRTTQPTVAGEYPALPGGFRGAGPFPQVGVGLIRSKIMSAFLVSGGGRSWGASAEQVEHSAELPVWVPQARFQLHGSDRRDVNVLGG